jgi:hypothetical protein
MPKFHVYKDGERYGQVSWEIHYSFPFNCGYFLIGNLSMHKWPNYEDVSALARRKINILVVKHYADKIGTGESRRLVFSDEDGGSLYRLGKQLRVLVGGPSVGNHGNYYETWLGSITKKEVDRITKLSTKGWELRQ